MVVTNWGSAAGVMRGMKVNGEVNRTGRTAMNMIRNIAVVILLITISPFAVIADELGREPSGQWMQPIITLEIAPDVSEEDAVEATVSKAAELNLVAVAVHRAEYVTTFELCAPSIAKKILSFDPTLAVYIPCRVSVIDRKIMTIDFSNVLQTLCYVPLYMSHFVSTYLRWDKQKNPTLLRG